jgi:membrane-associated protein
LSQLIDWLLHFDKHIGTLADSWGVWLYVVLFLIVFCETGLVVTPFLPGDSLLFAVGALAADNVSSLSLTFLLPTLIVAAILGDAVNYAIGYFVGPRVFTKHSGWLLNRKHLDRAQIFYERYGAKAIILARFLPILRTFAPFVAGIGKMNYAKFALYNVVGAIVWVTLFLVAGYLFGGIPVVKDNFHYVILGIIGISFLPVLYEWYRARDEHSKTSGQAK